MSTRRNNGSHYENHQRARELAAAGTHAHDVAAVHNDKSDHLAAHERTRHAEEYAVHALEHMHQSVRKSASPADFSHSDIAKLAYHLWSQRGCPQGSPEEDWFHAVDQLRDGGAGGER